LLIIRAQENVTHAQSHLRTEFWNIYIHSHTRISIYSALAFAQHIYKTYAFPRQDEDVVVASEGALKSTQKIPFGGVPLVEFFHEEMAAVAMKKPSQVISSNELAITCLGVQVSLHCTS
jgi:hypothetical protein